MPVVLFTIDVCVVVFEGDRDPSPQATRPHRAHFGRLFLPAVVDAGRTPNLERH